jgi:hypothetical protein
MKDTIRPRLLSLSLFLKVAHKAPLSGVFEAIRFTEDLQKAKLRKKKVGTWTRLLNAEELIYYYM